MHLLWGYFKQTHFLWVKIGTCSPQHQLFWGVLSYSWAKVEHILRVNFIPCNSQCRFSKIVPKLASSADNIGEKLGFIKSSVTPTLGLFRANTFFMGEIGTCSPQQYCFVVCRYFSNLCSRKGRQKEKMHQHKIFPTTKIRAEWD